MARPHADRVGTQRRTNCARRKKGPGGTSFVPSGRGPKGTPASLRDPEALPLHTEGLPGFLQNGRREGEFPDAAPRGAGLGQRTPVSQHRTARAPPPALCSPDPSGNQLMPQECSQAAGPGPEASDSCLPCGIRWPGGVHQGCLSRPSCPPAPP